MTGREMGSALIVKCWNGTANATENVKIRNRRPGQLSCILHDESLHQWANRSSL